MMTQCPWARAIWYGYRFYWRFDTTDMVDPRVRSLISHDYDLTALISYLCWEIWKECNNFIDERKPPSPSQVIQKATDS